MRKKFFSIIRKKSYEMKIKNLKNKKISFYNEMSYIKITFFSFFLLFIKIFIKYIQKLTKY